MTPVRLELAAIRSRVKHSTTEPLRSLIFDLSLCLLLYLVYASSESSAETEHKLRLDLSFTAHICIKTKYQNLVTTDINFSI